MDHKTKHTAGTCMICHGMHYSENLMLKTHEPNIGIRVCTSCNRRHRTNKIEQPLAPPIGIMPEYIWKQKRMFALILAISRFTLADKSVDEKWLKELGSLIPQVITGDDDEL